MRATVLDDVFARDNGRIVLSAIAEPVVLGSEFPLGCPAPASPFVLSGRWFEVAKYGIIHTELVRSLVGRWSHRRRYRRLRRSELSANQAEPGAAADRGRDAGFS